MSDDNDQKLYGIGIKHKWKLSRQCQSDPISMPPKSPSATSLSPVVTMESAPDIMTELDRLKEMVSLCHRCVLCEKRNQIVFGVGDIQASWLFVGEAPGENEDKIGEPFVGQAGKLLDEILFSIGLKRGQGVYIANAIKCRPPENRTPTSTEIASCLPYLKRQIELIKPQIIVALGKPATSALLGADAIPPRLGDMRGHAHSYHSIPVVVTYHPAYLLRNSSEKKKVWDDLLFAKSLLKSSKQS